VIAESRKGRLRCYHNNVEAGFKRASPEFR